MMNSRSGKLPLSQNVRISQKQAFKTTRVATLDPIDDSKSEIEPLIELEVDFNFPKRKNAAFHGKNVVIDHTPPLPPPSNSGFQRIFDQKIKSCCTLCNFNFVDADISAKAMKETLLEHFITFLTSEETGKSLSKENVLKILDMVKVNTIRKFDSIELIEFVCEDNPSVPCREWPHLQLIYQILLLVLKNYPAFIPVEFVETMIPLLNSTDQNERVQVKFFCGAYCFQNQQSINQVVITLLKTIVDFLNNVAPPYGVASILEIVREMSGMLNNNIYPIIIENYILPLMKTNQLSFFIGEMNLTLNDFMGKEQRYVNTVVDYLIKFFPKTKMIKQVYFLKLLSEAIPKLTQRDFSNRINKIFAVYCRAFVSPSSKVAEAAFAFWNDLEVQAIIGIFPGRIFPIALPALFTAAQEHWSPTVRQCAIKAIEFANKTDKKLVNDFQQVRTLSLKENEVSANWSKVAIIAARRDKSINVDEVMERFQYENESHESNPIILHSESKPSSCGKKLALANGKSNSTVLIVQPKLFYK